MREYCQRRRNLMHAGLAGIEGLRPIARRRHVHAGRHPGSGLSGAQFVRGLYDAERVSVLDGAVFGHTTEGFRAPVFLQWRKATSMRPAPDSPILAPRARPWPR